MAFDEDITEGDVTSDRFVSKTPRFELRIVTVVVKNAKPTDVNAGTRNEASGDDRETLLAERAVWAIGRTHRGQPP